MGVTVAEGNANAGRLREPMASAVSADNRRRLGMRRVRRAGSDGNVASGAGPGRREHVRPTRREAQRASSRHGGPWPREGRHGELTDRRQACASGMEGGAMSGSLHRRGGRRPTGRRRRAVAAQRGRTRERTNGERFSWPVYLSRVKSQILDEIAGSP
jgi:hypothetical protein